MSILPKRCVCGHDHETVRGEHVELCLECNCREEIPRCQNCGEESTTTTFGRPNWDVCSQRCARQLEYAHALQRRAVA